MNQSSILLPTLRITMINQVKIFKKIRFIIKYFILTFLKWTIPIILIVGLLILIIFLLF